MPWYVHCCTAAPVLLCFNVKSMMMWQINSLCGDCDCASHIFSGVAMETSGKGFTSSVFFFLIVILFLIAYYLNICLKMKTEINHNRKKDKKKKKKSQLRSIRPQPFSSSSSDALLLDMNLLWLFKAFFFFFSLLKCVIPAPRTSAVRRVQLLVNKAASLFRGFTDS